MRNTLLSLVVVGGLAWLAESARASGPNPDNVLEALHDVAKLTPAQKTKLKALLHEEQLGRKAVLQNAKLSATEKLERLAKLGAGVQQRLHQELTADQKKALETFVAKARDRKEDVKDRKEDRKDRREDVRDRKEDVKDRQKKGGAHDRAEDRKDRREDVRDRKEDLRDWLENLRDRRR